MEDEKVDILLTNALDGICAAKTMEDLEALRVSFLGKSGVLTQQLKGLGALPPEERKARGEELNQLKLQFQSQWDAKATAVQAEVLAQRLASEWQDVSLPAGASPEGRLHPIAQAMEEIAEIFMNMGFDLADGPEIEDGFHNFTALNIGEDHPARQMMDTFYLNGERQDQRESLVLRTHTSPVQIRAMKTNAPPLRLISLGRVYRSDYDQTHTPNFHQMEALLIDRGIHMGHLKGCLEEFFRLFFQNDRLKIRLRPSFFPFTEPSAEVDIGCLRQGGKILLGEGDQWLEVLGCGMVHPQVLKNCGIDPSEYQGFALGMGIERMAMLKYGISDLRSFYEGDVRWLSHYGFSLLEAPSPLTAATVS